MSTESKKFTDTILDEHERAKAQAFADDEVMQRAIKKILLTGIYHNGTLVAGKEPESTRNFAIQLAATSDKSNEQLGADLRATTEGIIRLEQGFDAIAQYKTTPEPAPAKPNKAR